MENTTELNLIAPCNLFDKVQQMTLKKILYDNQKRMLPFCQFMSGALVGDYFHANRELVKQFNKNSLNNWLHENTSIESIICDYRGKQKRENWDCFEFCFTFKLKNKKTMSFDYFVGTGHAFESEYNRPANINKLTLQQLESPCFKLHKISEVYKNQKTYSVFVANPSLYDLFYSLVLESDALENNFLDWCDNFGYDNDSIKALNIYNACVENGRKFRDLVGHSGIYFLREYLQDY